MHPHNPRSEAREVDGIRFESSAKDVWAFFPIEGYRAVVVKPYGATEFVVSWFALAHVPAADATKFAHAIGAAAKLADELNERKE